MKQALFLLAIAAFAAPTLRADTLTGRLVDGDEVAIVNGDVDAVDEDTGDEVILTGDSSDADGFFNITIPAGVYELTIQGPLGMGFVELVFEDVVIAGTLDMGTLVLEPGANLSGRVIDEIGFPVAACDLDVFHGISGDPVVISGGRTDLFGNFSIVVPPDTRVHYDPRNVFGATLAPRSAFYSIVTDTDVGDITLLPGLSVSGTIRRPNGQVVAGAKLDFTDPMGEEALTYGDTTDALGNFSSVVSADTWEIRICPPPTTTLAPFELLDVVISSTTNLGTLTLPAGVLLFGTLTDGDGLRVAGADVDVIDAASGESIPLCGDGTSAIGNYEVRVPPGTYHVLFSTPDEFAIRRDLVLLGQTRVDAVVSPCPPGSATMRNGTGVNPVALVAENPPRIARVWKVQLDCSGHDPSFGILLLHKQGHPGFPTSAGEFLLTGAQISVLVEAHTGSVISFRSLIGPNIALCGRTASGQGLILGSPGPRFTNALDLVVGH